MKTSIERDDLLAFAAKAQPARQSPCAMYADEIDELIALDVRQVNVLEWLSLAPRNITITAPDLSRWLARRRAKASTLPVTHSAGSRVARADLAAFAAASKPASRSPCANFEAQIDELIDLKVPQVKIVEWLSLPPRSVKISRNDLSAWLIRRAKRQLKANAQKSKPEPAGQEGLGQEKSLQTFPVPLRTPGVHVKHAEVAITTQRPVAPAVTTAAPAREAWERDDTRKAADALYEAAEKATKQAKRPPVSNRTL